MQTSVNPATRPIVRPAVPGDAALALSFVRKLADYERLSHEVRATAAGMDALLFGPRPYAEAAFAELGGRPVGFALYFHTVSTFAGAPGLWLEDLFVEPDVRGSGAGKALMHHVARVALERGCVRLDWSVLNWNEPSIGFYRRLGAQPVGDAWSGYRLSGEALQHLGRAD